MLKCLMLIFVFLTIGTFSLPTFKKSSEVDNIRSQYIALEKSLWNYVNKKNIAKIDILKNIFNNHDKFINNYLNIDFYDKIIFQFNTKNSEWQNLKKDLTEINQLFVYFRTVFKKYHEGEYAEDVSVDFAETLMNNIKLSAKYLYENIENVMIKIISYYRGMLNGHEQLSVTHQSCQQFLFSIYNNITLIELQGYAMMQFSFMILEINNKGNYTGKSNSIRVNYEKITEKTQSLLRPILLDADRIVWQSDPDEHIRNKTYDELTQFLQGYIENEVDLNPDGTCRENCDHYEYTRNHGCYMKLFCSNHIKCIGKILKCRFIDSYLQVCVSPPRSHRRYEYIETSDNRILGQKGNCNKSKEAKSWTRGIYKCSYCLCLCDDIRADRYFNLRETSSNVKANMVVTGLRFIKKNNIFHMQIQEGELLPKGKINLQTVRWKPVDDYRYFDRNIISGIDYHTLEWDKRDIDIDNIISGDPSLIVTGVQFKLIGNHLNFQVKFTEYNFETGKLINTLGGSLWEFNENTVNSPIKRKKLILQNPDIQIKSTIKSRPISNHNEYIEFTNSDVYKDAAQSAVPFIDIQEVASYPPVPLSGCGIYFKGRNKYGGFIAPKLITHDFLTHIQWPEIK